MTLEKAINLLQHRVDFTDPKNVADCYTALQLGIQALKDIQNCKLVGLLPPDYLLEGETEE